MKRILCLILSLILACGLLACGSGDTAESTAAQTTAATQPTQTEPAQTEPVQTEPAQTEPPAENLPTTVKSVKILAIGNSFSKDAMEHLYTVLKAEGVEEILLGNLYIGGCTLDKHAAHDGIPVRGRKV